MEIALEHIYPERDTIPSLEIIHRAYLKAKRMDKRIIQWKRRSIIKKMFQSIFFPQTIGWEYDRWRTSVN
jgi:hypothetical protein